MNNNMYELRFGELHEGTNDTPPQLDIELVAPDGVVVKKAALMFSVHGIEHWGLCYMKYIFNPFRSRESDSLRVWALRSNDVVWQTSKLLKEAKEKGHTLNGLCFSLDKPMREFTNTLRSMRGMKNSNNYMVAHSMAASIVRKFSRSYRKSKDELVEVDPMQIMSIGIDLTDNKNYSRWINKTLEWFNDKYIMMESAKNRYEEWLDANPLATKTKKEKMQKQIKTEAYVEMGFDLEALPKF